MSKLRERIVATLIDRRNKVLNGGINCIPSPFTRFRQDLPGIEQGKLYLISGGTKAAKSQITLYLFVLNTLLYCYNNPNKVKIKIFFFPLEESKEAVTLKVMAFLLHYITNGEVNISPTDLKSTDERKPLSQEILNLMNSQKFIELMNLYEEIVIFSDESNRVGIYKVLDNYAKTHGEFHYKNIKVKEVDELGLVHEVDRKVFDYYTSNNPDEYVIAIVDHVSLLSPIKSEDLRLTISNFAEDCIKLRNNCNMTFAIVQQQNIESTGLDAYKAGKIRPTSPGLADCKDFGKACNMMLGITNPHIHELPEYLGYDITKLKGNARFVEIVVNRDGNSNGICPLFFNGAINYFKELPVPSDKASMDKVYHYLNNLREQRKQSYSNLTTQAKVFIAWAKSLIIK